MQGVVTVNAALSLSLPDNLREYFEKYGVVKDVMIKYDPNTQQSRSVEPEIWLVHVCVKCVQYGYIIMDLNITHKSISTSLGKKLSGTSVKIK